MKSHYYIYNIKLIIMTFVMLCGCQGDDCVNAESKNIIHGNNNRIKDDNYRKLLNIINNKADINQVDQNGRTILFNLIDDSNNIDAIKLALANGANPNIKDNNGQTILISVSSSIFVNIVEALIAAGADVNTTNSQGNTALYYAAYSGQLDIVKALVKNGARINVAGKYGKTSLFDAVEQGEDEVAKFLIESGANINHASDDGSTPLHWVSHGDYKYVPRMRGAKKTKDPKIGQNKICEELLKHGANVNAKDIYGKTPLWRAVEENRKEIVKQLLDHGANKAIKDNSGLTPLDLAQSKGFRDIANLLD